MGRPRKVGLPDPMAVDLRRWVVGLPVERMHREVCAFLRGRADLVREAFAAWTLVGEPGWPEGASDMPLALRLRLAERMAIAVPVASVGRLAIRLLPFGSLVDPGPPRPVGGIETPGQLARRAVVEEFQRRLIREWWKVDRRERELLAEYEAVHGHLRRFHPEDRRLWAFLERGAGRGRVVRISGISCPLPSPESCRREPKPEPARAAYILLARRHRTEPRAVDGRLSRARLERRIVGAWSEYGDWLRDHPGARAEIDQVLPQVTREIAGPARDLSSPSEGETPAPPSL